MHGDGIHHRVGSGNLNHSIQDVGRFADASMTILHSEKADEGALGTSVVNHGQWGYDKRGMDRHASLSTADRMSHWKKSGYDCGLHQALLVGGVKPIAYDRDVGTGDAEWMEKRMQLDLSLKDGGKEAGTGYIPGIGFELGSETKSESKQGNRTGSFGGAMVTVEVTKGQLPKKQGKKALPLAKGKTCRAQVNFYDVLGELDD